MGLAYERSSGPPTSTTRGGLPAAEAKKPRSARRSAGRSTATTAPAPATCRQGGAAAVPQALALHGRPLLEFPPIVAGGKLYFVNNSGFAVALDADTGKQLWKRRIGRLNASSPAYYRHRLYIVNLVPGHVVKLDARTGRIIWKRSLPGRAESSPVVVGRSLYFGCEDGNLSRSAPQRQRALGDASAARSSRRPPTTAASSTSATTAAT